MSGDIPPPPPVPPAPVHTPTLTTFKKQTTFVTQICDAEDIRQTFKEKLKKIVKRKDGNKVLVSVNKDVKPVLQDGPSCGLVAAVMAAQILKVNITVDYVFNTAKDRGFTKQGEMFSADNMKTLVEDLIKCAIVTSLDLTSDQNVLVQHLIRGDLCLIPYDSDFNFEPCNKRGHKAHWALLTGFGLIIDRDIFNSKGLATDEGCVFSVSTDIVLSNDLLSNSEELFVYGLQGKSQYPGVWSLSSLIKSNRNLIEVDPNRQGDDIGYVLPEEGIDKALCSKALILSLAKTEKML